MRKEEIVKKALAVLWLLLIYPLSTLALELYQAKEGAVAYEQASSDSPVIYRFKFNEEFKVEGKEGEWLKVRFSTRKQGFVRESQAATPLSSPSKPSEASAQEKHEYIVFDFRGQKLGEPLDEQALIARGYDCMKSSQFDRSCFAPFNLEKGERIGNVLVQLQYYLLDSKFAGLDIGFGWAANDTIREAFTAKYGTPHKTEIETVQNRMGASFQRRKHTWQSTDGTLELTEGIDSHNGGDVSIFWMEALRIAEERKKTKGKEAAKDL